MNKKLFFLLYLAVWSLIPVTAVDGHFTKKKDIRFKDCSHETALITEMVAKFDRHREAEGINLIACLNISSITNNLCDGHPNFKKITMAMNTRITNATFCRMDCVEYLHIIFSGSDLIIDCGAFKSFKNLKILYLDGILKSSLPADVLGGRFEVYLYGILVSPASHDVTTAEDDRNGTSHPGIGDIAQPEEICIHADSAWVIIGKILIVAFVLAVVLLIGRYVYRRFGNPNRTPLDYTKIGLPWSETDSRNREADPSLDTSKTNAPLKTSEPHALDMFVSKDETNGDAVQLARSINELG